MLRAPALSQLFGSLLYSLQFVSHAGNPKMSTVSQTQPCECWSEGINSFPWPAGFAVASADCCAHILWYGHTVDSSSIRYSAGLLPPSGRKECAGHLSYGVRYLSWKEPYQISQRLFRDISSRLPPQVCKHTYITWADSWCCRMCAHTAFVGAASACVTPLMHTSGTESHLASVPRPVIGYGWDWKCGVSKQNVQQFTYQRLGDFSKRAQQGMSKLIPLMGPVQTCLI